MNKVFLATLVQCVACLVYIGFSSFLSPTPFLKTTPEQELLQVAGTFVLGLLGWWSMRGNHSAVLTVYAGACLGWSFALGVR